jgi:hypothetical protein
MPAARSRKHGLFAASSSDPTGSSGIRSPMRTGRSAPAKAHPPALRSSRSSHRSPLRRRTVFLILTTAVRGDQACGSTSFEVRSLLISWRIVRHASSIVQSLECPDQRPSSLRDPSGLQNRSWSRVRGGLDVIQVAAAAPVILHRHHFVAPVRGVPLCISRPRM